MRRTPAPIYIPDHLAYDAKLARGFTGQGHGLPDPSGLVPLLFAFGDLIIHSPFRTSSRDNGANLTRSYLDLSVLYGVDELENKLSVDTTGPKDYGRIVGLIRESRS
jgi:hypothetical protein